MTKCLLRSLAHFEIKLFVFLLLSCKCSLPVLDNSPLSDVSSANIFFQSVACLPILLILSFTEVFFFIIKESSYSIISFMDCAFGVLSSSYPGSSGFFALLFSRSFIVLHFTFRSMIHGVRTVAQWVKDATAVAKVTAEM